MTAVGVALAAACLAVGVFHLLRLAGPVHVPAELAAAAMGAGTAAMLVPVDGVAPAWAWTPVFVVVAGWAAVAVRRGGPGAVDARHHLLGSVAMVFMLVAGHGAGHGVGSGERPVVASVAAVVLAGYFGWHVLRCADRLRGTTPGRGLHDARLVAGAQVTSAGAMAGMLLTMV